MRIVYEDEHIIVIDKNAGILSMASDNEKYLTAYNILSNYVKQQRPANRIFIVHRLDRDTSGLMMFARSEKVQSMLQRDWKNNVTARTYIALVEGEVTQPEGVIKSYIYESKSLMMHSTQNPDKGDLAVTHFKTLKSNKDYSLLSVTLQTGKKNQIRLHMQELGHSIVGDKKYGASGSPIGRLGLHASVLAFKHPITGKDLHFESKAPAKFRRLV
jgi:23S rRNA pseudouridine1911/1915/1917 synthase